MPRGMYETYDLTACDDFTNEMGTGAGLLLSEYFFFFIDELTNSNHVSTSSSSQMPCVLNYSCKY